MDISLRRIFDSTPTIEKGKKKRKNNKNDVRLEHKCLALRLRLDQQIIYLIVNFIIENDDVPFKPCRDRTRFTNMTSAIKNDNTQNELT